MEDLRPGIVALGRWSLAARILIAPLLLDLLALTVAYALLAATELDLIGIGRVMTVLLAAGTPLLVILFVLSIVPVAGWIHRAHANLEKAGVRDLRHSAGRSVGSYFLPLANFVVPFRAMRELHNRSHGKGSGQMTAAVADVTRWWACHVAAVGIFLFFTLDWLADFAPALYVAMPPGLNAAMAVLGLLLLAGSAIFLVRTIGAITAAQRQMLHLHPGDVPA